jgi:hypothetical protein
MGQQSYLRKIILKCIRETQGKKEFYTADIVPLLNIDGRKIGVNLAHMPEIRCVRRRRYAHRESGHLWSLKEVA